MIRFLEFLGAVFAFFLICLAVFFFFAKSQGGGVGGAQFETASLEAQHTEMAQNNTLQTMAPGQCRVIEMYSMSWCGYCRIKRREFIQQGVAFNEYILDQNRAAERNFKRKMKEMGIKRYGYPTFIINGRYTRNYPVDHLVKQTCK